MRRIVTSVLLVAACSACSGQVTRSAPSGEAYPRLAPQATHDPQAQPVSTFSIDVDTAAYANVRRFARDGQVPPPDAVRIEELLNAFDYDLKEPLPGDALAVSTEVGACPWNGGHRLALIGVSTRRLSGEPLPPLNLTFLVDVSGSMGDDAKLPLVVRALGELAQRLRPTDRLSVVTYAQSAECVLAPVACGNSDDVRGPLERLRAGGGTNGEAGLRLAYDVNRRGAGAGRVNRIVLATDGDFNVGATDLPDLIALVDRERRSGVGITVLGFGTGNLTDTTLQAIAQNGDGNAAYVDSIDEARRVLIDEAGSTFVIAALDVKVQVEFNPAEVEDYRLLGYETRTLRARDFDDDAKDAGDMGVGRAVVALYEITTADDRPVRPLRYQPDRPVAERPEGQAGELLTATVRYRRPASDRVEEVHAAARDTGAAGSTDLRFAAAVAGFGLRLRGALSESELPRSALVAATASALGGDADGARRAFCELVENAPLPLSGSSGARPAADGPGLRYR